MYFDNIYFHRMGARVKIGKLRYDSRKIIQICQELELLPFRSTLVTNRQEGLEGRVKGSQAHPTNKNYNIYTVEHKKDGRYFSAVYTQFEIIKSSKTDKV